MLSENLWKLELHIDSMLAESKNLTSGEFKHITDVFLMIVMNSPMGVMAWGHLQP